MKTAKTAVLAAVFFMASINLSAQIAPVCDSGGVCGTDPSPTTDPSYAGLLAARPQVQNARGTHNPTVAVSGASLVIPMPMVIGSQSYNKAFPIVSLPGRGLDLNLTLYYNSRVWDVDTANSAVSLNTDRDSPSYGFRLDFGFMEYDANNAQFILTESDGSKHSMPLTANTTNGSIFDSNDGTSTEFNNQSLVLVYRNGTTVKYQAFPSQATLFRPIQMKDRNGNFITINYVAGTGNDQHIDTVIDTLGRVIKFVYDGANHLSQITQAVSSTTDSSGTHIWATFSWAQAPLTYNFASSLSVLSSPATGSPIWVLTSCSFANLTGYKFSYGAWGIINRIDQLSSTGKIRSYETYNFPDASQPLSDAPRYTNMIVSPDGITTSQWNYSETQSAIGQVTSETVTDQLGTSTLTTLNTNGTLKSVQVADNTGKIFRTVAYQWTTSGTPRVTSVTTTDDAGNQSSVSYLYDVYGNITDLGENDFGGPNIRHTITTYKQAPYTTNHIFNLQQSVQVKDAGGTVRQRTDFNYDETTPASLGAVTQNDGSIATPRGNMTSVTRYADAATPAGAITRIFTYDSTGNLTIAQVDCCNQKKFNFDPNSNYAYLSSVVRGPDGGQQFTSNFSFNSDNGLLLSSTDENSQPTSYQYDNMYRLKTVTPPPSNATSISRSISYADDVLAPTVTSSSSVNSAVLIQTFDGLGHLTRQDTQDSTTGNFVSTTQFQYDPIWRRKATSNPYAPGESLLWNNTGYDALNRVTSIAPPSGGNTQFNFAGNTITIIDPAGKQRKNFFDASGRLVRVDEPGWGDALTAIDSIAISGVERSKTYVPPPPKCPRPPLPCDPPPSDPVTVYDTGNVTATISGTTYSQPYGQNDTTTSVASNLAGKINSDPARVVNASPSGSTINLYAVNPGAGGNSISVSTSSVTSDSTNFGSGTTSFPASTFTPDLTGGENAVAQANAVLSATRHLTTTYTYDALDQLRAVSQGAIGPINAQTLAGQPRSYAYDDLGRLTSTTTPESGTVTNYYTKTDGTTCSGDSFAICRSVDARSITKTLTYNDPLNRLTGVTYSDNSTPPVTYAYDTGGQSAFALGRIIQITENGNSQAFMYDNLGRITSVMHSIDGTNYQIQYAYNPANQLTSVIYPSGRVVKPDYYSVGFLKQIADANAPSSPYLQINSADYNGAGQVKNLAYGNGIQGAVTYNDHLQLSTLRYFNPAAPAGTPDVLNLSYDYGTGNNGQIQTVHFYTAPNVEDTTKSETFSYDPWSRLSAAQTVRVDSTQGTWSLQWGFDRLGNRLQQALVGGNVSIVQPNFTISASTNQITNSGFTYDNAGNLTHDATAAYTYDGANRLTSVNNGSAVATYAYLGPLRIKKVNGSTATVYIYSGSRPIAEYVGGSVTKEYIYAGSTLLATIAGPSTTYHHPDHLSNRAETDATGALARSFGHFPYGETWYETSTDQQKFTTYPRDSGVGESGLDYAMFRHYNSGEGRFMSADLMDGDPFAPQSLNRYSYVTGDPINLFDPLGLCGIVTVTETETSPNGKKTKHTTVTDEGPCPSPDGGGGNQIGTGGGGPNPGGGGGRRPDCAGKTIPISPNLTVSSDRNGKINGVGIRLTGNNPVDGGQPGMTYSVPPNTWMQTTLTASSALNVAFNNHIIIETGFSGAFIQSATFSVDPAAHNNGNITEVKGAVDIMGFPMGRWDTPSDPLRTAMDGNSQLVNLLATANAIMNLLHMLDCTLVAGR